MTAFPVLRIPTALCWIAYCLSWGSALHANPQSPCTDVCSTTTPGTESSDIVCFDSDFAHTTNGSIFQKCLECEMGSTASDPVTGTTDVLWALYNMRFAVSACIFDYPVRVIDQSTPCQVSCQPLAQAIEYNLGDNVTTTSTDLSFCNAGEFDDKVINRCASCYGLMPGEVVMANFLQALHIACRSPPKPSQPFAVSTTAIFNSSGVMAGPTASFTDQPNSHAIKNLGLIIALPIVGALVVVALVGICCFFSIRSRRRKMRATGGMSRLHDSWADSPMTPYKSPHPQSQWDAVQAPVMMDQITSPQLLQQKRYSVRLSQPLPRAYLERVGPGAGQEKDYGLHDKVFPLAPEGNLMEQPSAVPPSLAIAVPKEREKRPDDDFIQYSDESPQSPQVFVYDKDRDRYVKRHDLAQQ